MSVSAVSNTTSASSSTATAAPAATNSLSYNDFLTLLMSELKNQDPTQPMDPGQMVTQLATVSQVGQAVQTNTTLSSLLTLSSALPGRDAGWTDDHVVRRQDLRNRGFSRRLEHRGGDRDAQQRLHRVAHRRRHDSMTEGDVLDLVQAAIWMVVVGAGPVVGAAMAVGVTIALLQALTQVQEMTLTFVPKLLVVFLVFTPHGFVHGGAIHGVHRERLLAHRARLRRIGAAGLDSPRC